MHEEHDLLDMWGPDVSTTVLASTALKQLVAVALGLTGFGYIVYRMVPESPAIPRQYPFSGLVKELGGLEENKVGSHLSRRIVSVMPF
jgi:NADH dehydrogenase (ubiquinone) 1 beta subcomplex subunit 8